RHDVCAGARRGRVRDRGGRHPRVRASAGVRRGVHGTTRRRHAGRARRVGDRVDPAQRAEHAHAEPRRAAHRRVSTSPAAAPAAGAGTRLAGLLVLACFLLGLLAANTVVATASTFGLTGASSRARLYTIVSLVAAAASIALGLLYVFGRGDIMPG